MKETEKRNLLPNHSKLRLHDVLNIEISKINTRKNSFI